MENETSSTIPEFCRRHKFSVGMYYKLKHQGLAPRELRIGRTPRITKLAELDWIEMMESRSTKAAASRVDEVTGAPA